MEKFWRKEVIKEKELREKNWRKDIIKERPEKGFFGDKQPEKPIIDKMRSYDKGLTEGGKLTEGWGGFGGAPESGAGLAQFEARVAVLEAALRQLTASSAHLRSSRAAMPTR